MAAVEVQGMDELLRGLNDLQREQLPFAMAKTLTDLASIAKDKTVRDMQVAFDRPTPYTLNALTTRKATKTELTSKVELKDAAQRGSPHHYLNSQAQGGNRWFKKFEGLLLAKRILPAGYFIVPGSGADIDAYGNISRKQITQILSYFDLFPTGTRPNMGTAGRARAARGTGSRLGYAFFTVQPGSRNRLQLGVYSRINLHDGSGQGPATLIRPVLLFVRAVTYQQKLRIQQIATDSYDENFNRLFDENLTNAVNTAFRR